METTTRTGLLPRRLAAILFLVMGCSAARSIPPDAASRPRVPPSAEASDLLGSADRARLEAIAAERANDGEGGGYRIGPDDLLEIRIPDLLEATSTGSTTARDGGVVAVVAQAPVTERGVRVAGDGRITIPVIGTVEAAGLAPADLEAAIGRRLMDAGILRRPQVSVQVLEHRSRVVAVVGSVERPGFYPATRPGATLAELIWAAGGPTRDAGRVVEFVPAASGRSTQWDGPPAELTRAAATGNPVRLDLQTLLHPTTADARLVNPPVRPGDLISLAPAGNVQVDGWVQKPGSYPLTRGLTLMGAVAAAGGMQFPAEGEVTVTRTLGSGEQRQIRVDVEAVRSGRAPDLPMIDGDVVQVPASYARLAPWAAWSVVKELVHVGGSVLLF
jgi:polysaccharide export outer membrane protein